MKTLLGRDIYDWVGAIVASVLCGSVVLIIIHVLHLK